jgi:hypothetical protein
VRHPDRSLNCVADFRAIQNTSLKKSN